MVSRPLLAALGVVVAIAVVVGALFLVVPAGPKVEEVRIGLLTPLTGPAAAFGNDMKAMAELIAEQVNAQGGIRSL
jgi:branched-chain amino acid transport system substrate-binding protein